jgi:hypothetical protein
VERKINLALGQNRYPIPQIVGHNAYPSKAKDPESLD